MSDQPVEPDPRSRAFFLGLTGVVVGMFVDLLLGPMLSFLPAWGPAVVALLIGAALTWKERYLGIGFVIGVIIIEAGVVWLIADF